MKKWVWDAPCFGKNLVTSLLVVGGLGLILFLTTCSSRDDGTDKTYKEELARHLTSVSAVMYGAYWCPHCNRQKTMFDDDFKHVTYVECDPKGEDANPQLCQSKGIAAYPTWEINGGFYEGVLSLEMLAKLSGFPSP